MSLQSRRRSHHSPDPLILFLQDAARIKPITGREHYLPLTRRIERARLLRRLRTRDASRTLTRIIAEQRKAVEEFNLRAVQVKQPTLNLGQLAAEVDLFVDTPAQRLPPALLQYFSSDSRRRDEALYPLGWRCLYLTALLPPALRVDNHTRPVVDSAIYFREILHEGKQAKRRLVKGTLRYVLNVARLYVGQGVPYLELIQEGYLGLAHACDRFCEEHGTHFQSYAATWIRQRITRYIAETSRLVRVPIHRLEKMTPVHRSRLEKVDRQPESITELDIMALAGWLTIEEISLIRTAHALQQQPPTLSLDDLTSRLETYYHLLDLNRRNLSNTLTRYWRHQLDEVLRVISDRGDTNGTVKSTYQVFSALRWVTAQDADTFSNILEAVVERLARKQQILDDYRKLLPKIRKARQQLYDYYAVNLPPHSLDSSGAVTGDGLAYNLRDTDAARGLLAQTMTKLLEHLNDRQREVISLRYGLEDGTEHTLEEVGAVFGVTRERIRQIEAKSFHSMSHPARSQSARNSLEIENSWVDTIPDRLRERLLRRLDHIDQQRLNTSPSAEPEIARIEALMRKYYPDARRRQWDTRRLGSRAELLREALLAIGQPAHYGDIHTRAMMLAVGNEFPKTQTYTTLMYHRFFRAHGNAIFGLVEWNYGTDEHGEHVFERCPQPLLPDNPHSRAFLESVLVTRQTLTQTPDMSAGDFYSAMLAWSGRANHSQPQDAFDAWYVAGALKWVDFSADAGARLILTLPLDGTLDAVRQHCLTTLCTRVLRMPEILLALERLAAPTVPLVQQYVFGSESAGFDVPTRLALLAALDAARGESGVWSLTDIGRTVLANGPTPELPDFDDVAAYEAEAQAVDETWDDLLETFDL